MEEEITMPTMERMEVERREEPTDRQGAQSEASAANGG